MYTKEIISNVIDFHKKKKADRLVSKSALIVLMNKLVRIIFLFIYYVIIVVYLNNNFNYIR